MGDSLPILTFHTLEEDPSPIAFPAHLFHSALSQMEGHGYRTLTLKDAVAALDHPDGFPERALVLTFDDGYRSVYETAFPLLRAHRMTATVFVTTGREFAQPEGRQAGRLPPQCGREMLSWEEIREMSAAGIEFGAHTLTHPDLTRLPADRLQGEIGGGREEIERVTGVAVRSFAYPFGRWNRRAIDEVKRSYACACTDRLALASRRCDRFTLPRVDAYYLRSPWLLRLLFSQGLPFYLRARNLPRTVRRLVRPSPG
jgi:peptidoglycan/xylan/chitin deacetylase (PgdA/CDA1 family)